MCEFGDGLQADDRGVAFDRVRAAQQVGAPVEIVRLFDGQQSRLEAGDVFDGLGDERRHQLVAVQIKLRHATPSSVLKISFRPRVPPTSLRTMSMPRAVSSPRATSALRIPR